MSEMTVQQAVAVGLGHHQAGRLKEAEGIYRHILTHDPSCPDAWHLLGVLALQARDNVTAVELIQRALGLHQGVAAYYGNLGVALEALGRVEEAIEAWQRALDLQPAYPEALNNLGRALEKKGRIDEAADCWEKALAARPGFVEVYNNLGVARVRQGRWADAEKLFRQTLAVDATHVEAWQNLGQALREMSQLEEAEKCERRALELRPNFARAWTSLGDVLRCQKRWDEAKAAYEKALELDPAMAEAAHMLGVWAREQNKITEAIGWYRKAVAMRQDAEWLSNLGATLQEAEELPEALEWLEKAAAMRPEHPGLHLNYSLALLVTGQWKRGWAEYEWRLKCPQFKFLQRDFQSSKPRWDGQALQGQRILLYAEQGLGDAIQFVRYARLVTQRGGEVVLECQPALQALFRQVAGVKEVVAKGDNLPPFELQASLLSLPGVFVTTPESVPGPVGYIQVDANKKQEWARRMGPANGQFRVGLVWAGNPANSAEWKRTMEPEELAALRAVAGVEWYSLQKVEGDGVAQRRPGGLKLVDWMGEVQNFSDTAGLMANLDLIVGVDTSVIHLAGALGKPVWVMLPHAPDWRWLREQEQTPWYPTMQLFRQRQRGQWGEVVQRVAQALAGMAHKNR